MSSSYTIKSSPASPPRRAPLVDFSNDVDFEELNPVLFESGSPNVKEHGATENSDDNSTADTESQSFRERDEWDNQWEFLLSCISMSVGLGNIWRFPVTAYENGGVKLLFSAFLVPYLCVLFFIGRPIYFMELSLGQFSSYSQVKAWKLAPMFKGVGYGAMISTMSVITYYVYVMSLCIRYFLASFNSDLPWATYQEHWTAEGGSCYNNTENTSIPEMYYKCEVTKELTTIENGIGWPDVKLSGCLIISWILIFASLVKGVKSSGKVAYFTGIFPYFVMITLLIRGATLEGAWTGIMYFITPRWEKLLEPQVWYEAVTQCFFSLNTCFGSIIMFSSHNKFRHNIYRDAWIVSLMDTCTSLLAGFTIFAVLGNLAFIQGTDVSEVVKGGGGAGLAFISYADAISKFDWYPQIFAALFFIMLFTLGLGSTISDVGTVITIFCDRFPKVVRWKVTLVASILGCSADTNPGGEWIMELVDFFGGSFVIFTTAILELVGVAWIYGVYNFIDDIEFMLKKPAGWLGLYWKVCWGLIIPIFMTGILIYSLADGGITPTHNNLQYPLVALVCGWVIALLALMSLPGGAIHSIMQAPGDSFKEKFFRALKPSPKWGPRNPLHRLLGCSTRDLALN
ncbi:Sodium-dependent nutrient amino acid transporter 1 [Orchesella cincta]|uniref:Sodium-dependent nutrient amino acid transporter 1 n=1 Tax=Orchesella cincta TaxID=48709 RepID=A0A1D2MZ90_ORCCI|nr:Sodium-dependent nutrient amino acid transporter 1 [Orchesella cincta]